MRDLRNSMLTCSRRLVGTVTVLLFALSVFTPATASPIEGGVMYDKWWEVTGVPVPPGEHPLYPPVGGQSGDTTFRCKECHGWDYKGAAGAYGPGSSHFTGIPGVFGSALTGPEMFDLLKSPDGDGSGGTVVNGHGYGDIGILDASIQDAVDFLQSLLLDTDDYIDPGGLFTGSEPQGMANYMGPGQCADCHGPDGTWINFGTPEAPIWVGDIATENPWEFLHKVRFGQPGTPMPSWVGGGGSDQGAADIGVFVQSNFPLGSGGDGGDGGDVPASSGWGMALTAMLLLGLAAKLIRR